MSSLFALALFVSALVPVHARTLVPDAQKPESVTTAPSSSREVPEYLLPPSAPGFVGTDVTDIRRGATSAERAASAASAPLEASRAALEGAAALRPRRAEPPVPPPKEQGFSLFGLGARPTPPPRDEPLRQPEFYAVERSGANTAPATARGGQGRTLEIPLDAAMPVLREGINWMRSNRDAVLVASLAVLAITWMRTRRPGKLQATPARHGSGAGSEPSRRRRRHRHAHGHGHGHSSRYAALPGGSSHSSSRSRSEEPWAGDAGRSSGRHR